MENTHPPVFQYNISGRSESLSDMDRLWNTLLCTRDSSVPVANVPYTIGDYLLSAKKFIEENNYNIIKKGLKLDLKKYINEINRILISLEKHGPFYHPIKVTAILNDKKSFYFVLNGAVSDIGLAVIENEYENLKELNKQKVDWEGFVSEKFLPEVYGMGFVKSDKGIIGFFLAQWFDMFEEFHIVKTASKNEIGILNSDGTFSFISDSEAFELFKKASMILSFYYDLKAFKQIFPWHHAAGDFIVKICEKGIEVKLIAVRGYGRLLDNDNLLFNLLMFFLNLCLRMRIDRNKGVGEYTLFNERYVKAIVEGFLLGLQENSKKNKERENSNLCKEFIKFIKDIDLINIKNLFEKIAESYNNGTAENSIIQKNLNAHAKAVFKIIEDLA